MKVIPNQTKQLLADGAVCLGMGVRQARTVDIAAIAKSCDYDWLFIDMEHNSMSVDGAAQICAAALQVGISPIVRVPSHDSFHATRLLDAGAQGIVVPHVSTADQARLIVDFCRFPPLGHRSIPGGTPQTLFQPLSIAETIELLNPQTLVVAMIETAQGLNDVEQIAAVEGIDVLLVGCSDLSAELGIAGQLGHPSISGAIETVCAAARRNGKYAGFGGVYDESLMTQYIRHGAQFILSGSDLAFLMAGARSRSAKLRAAHAPAVGAPA